MELTLGDLIKHKGNPARVVRIVSRSLTLFEPEDGTPYIMEESYVELKGSNGGIDFLMLTEERHTYDGPEHCPIRGLDPISVSKKGEEKSDEENSAGANPDGVASVGEGH